MATANPRVVRGGQVLSFDCLDPLLSSVLRKHWKAIESKTVLLPVALITTERTATNDHSYTLVRYSCQPS